MAKAKQSKTTAKAEASKDDEAEVVETTSTKEGAGSSPDESLPTGTRRQLPPE